MQEVVLLIQLLEDLKVTWDAITTLPKVLHRVFEDNQSCIAVTKFKKSSAYTKHIAIKYYYFCSLVDNSTIKIKYVDTKNQIAGIFTKLIKNNQLFKLWYMLIGWLVYVYLRSKLYVHICYVFYLIRNLASRVLPDIICAI